MPPYARTEYLVFPIIDLVITNNLKVLVGSLRYSVDDVKLMLKRSFRGIIDEESLDRFFKKYIVFGAVNPYGMSMEELFMLGMELVERHSPDMFIIHGLDLFVPVMKSGLYRYYDSLINHFYLLKSMGKLIAGIINDVDKEQFLMYSSLADIVMKIFMRKTREGIELYVYIWRKGKTARVLGFREALGDIREIFSKHIKQLKT